MLNRLPPFRRRLTQLLMTLLAASLLFTLLPSTALSRPPDKMALANSGDPIGGERIVPDMGFDGCYFGTLPIIGDFALDPYSALSHDSLPYGESPTTIMIFTKFSCMQTLGVRLRALQVISSLPGVHND